MADYLKYDTDQMASTRGVYNSAIESFGNIKDSMKAMVENVQDAWKSEASDAFFDKFKDEWLDGFEQYQEVLEHMVYNLDISIDKYSEITNQANKLNIR